MALVIDERVSLAGVPGVHALIVGVSEYKNLPPLSDPPEEDKWFLNKLTSPALSALKIFSLLKADSLRLPIKTVRLLLAPSEAERAVDPTLGLCGAGPATRAHFETMALDWRTDAATDPRGMTVFYFAGHGLQRGPEEGVILFENFLDPGPPLAKCALVGDIKNGMAPSPTFPNIALTQFYFIDTCLTRQSTQNKFVGPQVFDVFGAELNVVDRREAPVIFSTVDGAIALGRDGKPSHFSEALALALERGSEDPEDDGAGGTRWPVTSLSIKTALDLYYAKHRLGTKVKMGGVVGSPVIRHLARPPLVDLAVQVQPSTLVAPCDVLLHDDNDVAMPQCNPGQLTAFETTVRAGIYRVLVSAAQLRSPYKSQRKFITQRGPHPWLHDVRTLIG